MNAAAVPLPQYAFKPGSSSPDGRTIGAVRIVGSCVYIEAELERVLPIWPEGAVSWSRPGERFLYQGREYEDGTEIMVSGGEARQPEGKPLEPSGFVVAPAATCDTRLLWIVAPG